MKRRCILIIPKFIDVDKIEEIREKYDPNYGKVAPHITLVFPFFEDLSNKALVQHVCDQISDMKPFTLTANGITAHENEYIILNITEGYDSIVEMHDSLYSGILAKHENKQFKYNPHITIGRLKTKKQRDNILVSLSNRNYTFETVVDEIAIEEIDSDEKGTIAKVIPLKCNEP